MTGGATAPLVQFRYPGKAHRSLLQGGAAAAMGVTALLILAGGAAAGAMSSLTAWELPFFILLERTVLAFLGGLAVWGLARAMGERVSLIPGLQSAFMAMAVWVLGVAALMALSLVLGVSPGFTWSLGELAGLLPSSRTGVFLFLVMVNLDLPSAAAVFVWGRGLSGVWETKPSFGMRMVWAVYLFAVILQAVPVLLTTDGGEVI